MGFSTATRKKYDTIEMTPEDSLSDRDFSTAKPPHEQSSMEFVSIEDDANLRTDTSPLNPSEFQHI